MSDKKPSFLGRLIRWVFALVFLATVILGSMYSGKIERYPWQWSGDEWSGFKDYCLLKYEEVKAEARVIATKLEDSKFGEKLEGLASKLKAKIAGDSETPKTPETPKPDANVAEKPAEMSEGERLWQQGYELRKQGNRAEGDERQKCYEEAVSVWRKAIPALQAEIETAKEKGDTNRVQWLEELRKSLNDHLHDIMKDAPV